MSYLLSFSPIDFSKNFAFGLGIGVGLGVVLRRFSQEKQRKREHLISCLKQLAAEVRQLRETFVQYATTRPSLDAIEDVSSDDEFYDTDRGNESNNDDFEGFLRQIDQLQSGSSADHQDAYNLLINKTNQIHDNAELLWRFAKSQYQISCLKEKAGDSEAQKLMLLKGIDTAKEAIEIDETNYRAHQWYAILIGTNTKNLDNKEKILSGYEYKQHIERAIELNDNDATSYFLYGRYLFEVSMLPWYMRKAASALFAEPPTAKIEDALAMFKKAEEIRPGFYVENPLFIGKCYYQMSKYKEAKEWLSKAVNAECKTDEDKKTKQEALNLMKKC